MGALESTVGAMIDKIDNQIRNPRLERSEPADQEQFTDPKLGNGVSIGAYQMGLTKKVGGSIQEWLNMSSSWVPMARPGMFGCLIPGQIPVWAK